jgi:glycosyltransferase involved in cell wall biosynthesis
MGIAISIIIPTYNSEKYIEKCIQSVIRQTLEKIEILIVDNVSNDQTVKLAESLLLNSNRIFKIISNPKLGVSCSRNIGLSMANGEYVYFLDSDDYLTDNYALETVYNLAKSKNLDIVHFGFDRVNENGNIITRYNQMYKYVEYIGNIKKILKEYLLGNIWFWTGNAIYKREIIQKNFIMYVENCFVGEDQEYIIKVIANSMNVLSIKKSLVNYVIRKNSLSKKTLELFQAVDTFERIKEYLNIHFDDFYDLIFIIDNYKIPYLIMRAVFKSVKFGASLNDIMNKIDNNPKYINYLKNVKFSTNHYYFLSYISTKIFLLFPRFSFCIMKVFSKVIMFG